MYKFNSLTPKKLNEIKPVYKEALDYAFKNEDIKNIAITGIYGAGKSTIWRSYASITNKKNIITVSLGKYEDCSEKDIAFSNDIPKEVLENCRNSVDREVNRIERQLINQMLSQIDIDKIPLSKLVFKQNKSKKKVVGIVVLILLFIMAISSIIFIDTIIEEVNKIFEINKLYFIIGSVILATIPVSIFLYSLLRSNKIKLSKLNLKGTEANFEQELNDETVLDRDIKEIVYLLNSSDTNIIVFEDLDRYENVEILTKLRELNFLLNSFINSNGDKRTVKFIYMIKDGLFFSKNRTKFFDFIIPIVPVVDSKNSENELKKLLNGIPFEPDINVLSNISLYVDDMRLLKNIVNEYIVYSNIIPINDLELDKNKLFALVTLKNIFPNEFDLLQEDEGYIRRVFDKLGNCRKSIISNLENELDKNIEKLQFFNSRLENDKFEAMALMIQGGIRSSSVVNQTWAEYLKKWSENPTSLICVEYQRSSGYSSGYFNYQQFIDRFIAITDDRKVIIENMSEDNEKEIHKLEQSIEQIRIQLSEVDTYSYRQLIKNMNQTKIEEIFSEDSFAITCNHYFPLIRYLIADGLLDETYWYYKGNFDVDVDGVLKKNDIIYLKGLIEARDLDVFLKIETPSEIINRLKDLDYSRFNILNKNLVEFCLNTKRDDLIIKMADSVKNHDNYIKMLEIMETLNPKLTKTFVDIFINSDLELLIKLLDLNDIPNRNVFTRILLFIYTNPIIESNKLKLFNSYLECNENICSLVDTKDYDKFVDNLQHAEIKLKTLRNSLISDDRLEKIEKIKAYELTIDNIKYIVENLIDEKINYGNLLDVIYYRDILKCTKSYCEENFASIIHQYINSRDENERFSNSEDILIDILLSEISIDDKVEYAKNNDVVISDISALKSIIKIDNIFVAFFKQNKIKMTIENIDVYWDEIEEYTKDFIEFLEKNIDTDVLKETLQNNKDMCNCLINDHRLNDDLFECILLFSDKAIENIDPFTDKKRVKKLINNNLFSVTKENIKFLVENNLHNEIIHLTNLNNGTKEDDVIKILTGLDLQDKLIYKLINSSITDENVFKLLKLLNNNVLLEQINTNKEKVLNYIMLNYLSFENIRFICNTFESFRFKNDFIDCLDILNKYDVLDNECLNEKVMEYILLSKVSTDIKINVIIVKIKNGAPSKELERYINKVNEIKELSKVWSRKYPLIDNRHKEKISQVLIDGGYIKERNGIERRIMLNKKNSDL